MTVTNRTSAGAGVLLISPHAEDHRLLRDILHRPAWTLYIARTLREAMALLPEAPLAAAITDCRLPDGGSWKDFLRQLEAMGLALPVIVADRFADDRLWAEVLNLGGYDVLMKPLRANEVLHVLTTACNQRRSSLANLRAELHGCAEDQPAEEPERIFAALAHP
jgi:two-component system, NtrC family, response regulator HydG